MRDYGKAGGDNNAYTTGVLGGKPVVLVYPPGMGVLNAANVATNLRYSSRNIRLGLVVGIAGGAPQTPEGDDIYLGDVLISTAVIQYDFGRYYDDGPQRRTELEKTLSKAPHEVLNFLTKMRGQRVRGKLVAKTIGYRGELVAPDPHSDYLFDADYRHKHRGSHPCVTCGECATWSDPVCTEAQELTCEEVGCRPNVAGHGPKSTVTRDPREDGRQAMIYFGQYASGNSVVKSARLRDRLAKEDKVIGFEMEGAGTWEHFPTVLVKSVCDYADSHKSKKWQAFAAATAASCAKAVLEEWHSTDLSQIGTCLRPMALFLGQGCQRSWLT